MTEKEKKFVEKVCKNIDSPLRPQIETIVQVVLSLQTQLEENYNEYLTQPLSISVTVGTGETISRANPFCAEYRALFKDYIAAVKQLKELIADVAVEEELTALASVKERFKIAK
jgi:hypothetical protein